MGLAEAERYFEVRTLGENDFLRGAFYGPNHEEVAGIFEHWQGLVGAYGARREGE